MYRNSIILGLFITLLGCASTEGMKNPPAYAVLKVGDSLVVNQTLTIPPHLARVYFQDGAIVGKRDVDQYRPSCNLLSYIVPATEQTIVPDTFRIVRVRKRTELVQAGTVMLASNQLATLDLFNKDNQPMAEIFITVLDIQSAKNPEIKRMECQAWRRPLFGDHLILEEIQQSVGDYISFSR